MPKPTLIKEQALLERQIIETLQAGLHEWRPDLKYPQSNSDMQACVRGLMKMFDIKRLPLARDLEYDNNEYCPRCKGIIDGHHECH